MTYLRQSGCRWAGKCLERLSSCPWWVIWQRRAQVGWAGWLHLVTIRPSCQPPFHSLLPPGPQTTASFLPLSPALQCTPGPCNDGTWALRLSTAPTVLVWNTLFFSTLWSDTALLSFIIALRYTCLGRPAFNATDLILSAHTSSSQHPALVPVLVLLYYLCICILIGPTMGINQTQGGHKGQYLTP